MLFVYNILSGCPGNDSMFISAGIINIVYILFCSRGKILWYYNNLYNFIILVDYGLYKYIFFFFINTEYYL